MFPGEMLNDRQVFLFKNVSKETLGGWQEFFPWIIS
jgi:hypothetical protein